MGTRYNRLVKAVLTSTYNLCRLIEAVLTSTYNLCFEQKYEKYQNFILKFSFFGGKIFSIFELACFRYGKPQKLSLWYSMLQCYLGPFIYFFSRLKNILKEMIILGFVVVVVIVLVAAIVVLFQGVFHLKWALNPPGKQTTPQLALFIHLQRAVIGPSATLKGR